jgi:hypothetical protein
MTAELGAEDRAPELVPLNAIFATDFVQILVPVTTANTMAEVAAAVGIKPLDHVTVEYDIPEGS